MAQGDAGATSSGAGGEPPGPVANPGGGTPDHRTMLASMGHAVIATDMSGTVLYLNAAAEQLYGWASAEAVGRNIAEVTVPQIDQELAAEIMAVLRRGGSWSGAFTVQRRDGSVFPALVTDTGIADDRGRLAGIVGVSIDLGEPMRLLMAGASDAVLMVDRDDRITLTSPAAARLFGWSEERALGISLWDLVLPDDRDATREHYREALSDPSQARSCETRVIRYPEGWCWAELVVNNLLDAPAARYVVCNLRDVTERHNNREHLLTLTRQLQTALTTRVVLEQAKGIIAERHGVSADQAFEMLRRHSRAHHARLHDVAAAVVNLGLRI